MHAQSHTHTHEHTDTRYTSTHWKPIDRDEVEELDQKRVFFLRTGIQKWLLWLWL